jgi:hypothetical protein
MYAENTRKTGFQMAGAIIATSVGLEKMIKRRFKMRITGTSRQTVTFADQRFRAPCPECHCEVDLVTKGDAAGILQITYPLLEQLLGAGPIHSIRAVNGAVWVCRDSLFRK